MIAGQRLVTFGAVEVALTVMHAFPELLDVQLNGCGMLQNLATSPQIQSMVAQLSGLKIVLHSMTVHAGTGNNPSISHHDFCFWRHVLSDCL